MEFLVPWRFLVPNEHLPAICAQDSADIKHIARVSGARVDVVGPGEACTESARGHTLMTIYGTMWQKRTAGRALVDRLFELQGVEPTKWWTFSRRLSCVLPNVAHDTVVSPEIAKSIGDVGAKLFADDPGKGDTARFLVHLEGNAQQIVSATARINTALQDLVDRSCASEADFSEVHGSALPTVADLVRAARVAPAAGAEPPPARPPTVGGPSSRRAETANTLNGDVDASRKCQEAMLKQPFSVSSADLTSVDRAKVDAVACNGQRQHLGFGGVGNGLGFKTTQALMHGMASKLLLVMPADIVENFLVREGHLASIADVCHVQIDLGPRQHGLECPEVVLALRGSVVCTSLATLHLQWRAAQHVGMA